MKHSILLKFLALALTALSLVTAVAGVAGIVVMEGAGLYVNGLDVLQEQQYRAIAETLAEAYSCNYIADQMDTCPEHLRKNLYRDILSRYDRDVWGIRLHLEGQTLSETQIPNNWGSKIEITVDSEYPIAVTYPTTSPETSDTTLPTQMPHDPETTVPSSEASKPENTMPDGWTHYSLETVWEQGELAVYLLYYYPGPTYTVTVYLQEQVLQSSSLHLLTGLYPYRYTFIWMLALGLTVFAAGLVYLMCAAGHTREGTIRPSGLKGHTREI